jgi:metal transporter CNNM
MESSESVEAEKSFTEGLSQVEWWRWLIIFFLVVLSGCYSGLNLGVLGLDVKDMEMMVKGPHETEAEEKDARLASKLLPLRRRGNLLLCAILLGNVMVNSLLSILMSDIAGGAIGLLVSTAVIVIFGEIMPQAVFSRHGVKAGAILSPLLYVTICITFIFSYPIAAILDKVLGEEVGSVMTRNKMKHFFEMQERNMMIEGGEGKILRATLELSKRYIEEVMIPIEKVYMLELNTLIDREVTQEIYSKGFSRIPIYDGNRQNICGVLMAKDLILFNPDRDQMTIKQMSSSLRDSINFDNTTTCLGVLSQFRQGTTHMAMVTKIETDGERDPYLRKIGLITLEDIIEEVIGEEIEDEFEGDGKEERRQQKEQLLALFMNRKAHRVLHENELKAIQ